MATVGLSVGGSFVVGAVVFSVGAGLRRGDVRVLEGGDLTGRAIVNCQDGYWDGMMKGRIGGEYNEFNNAQWRILL